ncbi:hypothetical protein [Pseudomonas simiae]|uniref:hypothetical protein n=1 Tax=Pseudomonas simiae TaxID=321846 RepID=UPI0021592F2B|nr:hypothetical protein [Pseudomonas simiae]
MVWQRAGTVAVENGSTTVIGTNVDFAASSRNGDSFIGPDGVNYELVNVASSTVISIQPAYKGPTVSGAAYAIMPVQGYDKMLSDAFNNLNNQFGSKLAALGTTGNYDILPVSKGGTGRASVGTAIDSDVTTGATSGVVGQLLKVSDFGIGSTSVPYVANVNEISKTGVYKFDSNTLALPSGFGTVTHCAYDTASNNWTQQAFYMSSSVSYFRQSINASISDWAKVYTTANTTRASDGTLKAI